MKRVVSAIVSLCFGLLVIFSWTSALAEVYFLKTAVNASVPSDQMAAINDLVRMAVSGVSGVRLVGEEAEASAVLDPQVVKIGNAYVLGLTKIRNGQIVFQQQARAASLEDMDTVAVRVARATITERPFKSDTRVSDVTEDQVTRGTRRKETVNQWFIGFGPGTTTHMNSDNNGVYWSFGYTWGMDEQFNLNIGAELLKVRDSNSYIMQAYVGGDYHLSDHNTSPYLSVGLGYGSARAHTGGGLLAPQTDSASGWVASAGAGIKFFRASRVNLGLSGRYVMVTEKTSTGLPAATVGAITLYF
jgi:hypothetical protein